MQVPTQPAEAELIERLRQAVRPKLSVRKAAESAGISEGRWRQIAKGYNQVSKDTVVPSIAPADTLARMARVVGATPAQLREAGREDAATELETIHKVESGWGLDVPAARDESNAITDEIYDRMPHGGSTSWPDPDTEGGRLTRQSLTDLIVSYMESRDRSPEERADLMIKATFRAISTVRQILVRDDGQTVRAHAIDALNPAEAAMGFLKEAIEEMKGRRHDMADQKKPGTPTQAGPPEEASVPDELEDGGIIDTDVGSKADDSGVSGAQDGQQREDLTGG